MSCALLHPMHSLPIANAIVARNIPVTLEIDALPRRKRVRAIISALVADNLEAYRHRYAGNPEALADADAFAKTDAKAFTSQRTLASPEIVYALASSWHYQASDHREYDKLATGVAMAKLFVALAKEIGVQADKIADVPAYQAAARTYWNTGPAEIQPLIDAATRRRLERRSTKATTPKVDASAAELAEAKRLLASVLSDITAMRDKASGPHWFGGFSEYDADNKGGQIEWPNLSITGESIATFLAGQQSLPMPATTQPATPAPTSMAAFVQNIVGTKAA